MFEGGGGMNPWAGWRTLNSFTRNRKENKWGYDRTLFQRFGASASLQEIECEFWTASIDSALLDRGRNPHFFLALRAQKRRGVLDLLDEFGRFDRFLVFHLRLSPPGSHSSL